MICHGWTIVYGQVKKLILTLISETDSIKTVLLKSISRKHFWEILIELKVSTWTEFLEIKAFRIISIKVSNINTKMNKTKCQFSIRQVLHDKPTKFMPMLMD